MTLTSTASLSSINEIVDEHGYPTDEALALIENWTGTPRVLVEDLLSPIFEYYGNVSGSSTFNDHDQPVRQVRFATGGWSGCEDALASLKKTFFWMLWWGSSSRGGVHVFEIPGEAYDKPMTALPQRGLVLDDTVAVGEFMRAFGQEVRTVPTAEVTSNERLLRGRIVVEEALELADALGLVITTPGHDIVAKDTVTIEIDPAKDVDLVETLDATTDLIVVVKGTAHTFGLPVDEAFEVVHASNMAKLGPDGQPIRRADGKVLKPEGWVGPTEGLIALLREHGWEGTTA